MALTPAPAIVVYELESEHKQGAAPSPRTGRVGQIIAYQGRDDVVVRWSGERGDDLVPGCRLEIAP